jgi:hypothetical protein
MSPYATWICGCETTPRLPQDEWLVKSWCVMVRGGAAWSPQINTSELLSNYLNLNLNLNDVTITAWHNRQILVEEKIRDEGDHESKVHIPAPMMISKGIGVRYQSAYFVRYIKCFFVELRNQSDVEGVYHIAKKDSAKSVSSACINIERRCTWCSVAPDVSLHMMSTQRWKVQMHHDWKPEAWHRHFCEHRHHLTTVQE